MNDSYFLTQNIKREIIEIILMAIVCVVFIIMGVFISWGLFLLIIILLISTYSTLRFRSSIKIDKTGIHLAKWNGLKSSTPDPGQIMHIPWLSIKNIDITIGYKGRCDMSIITKKSIINFQLPDDSQILLSSKMVKTINENIKLYSGRDMVCKGPRLFSTQYSLKRD